MFLLKKSTLTPMAASPLTIGEIWPVVQVDPDNRGYDAGDGVGQE